ncbi:MAG TPA: DUF6282 family protein [Ktedonobacterales bacterium]|nr:DUF6282 family protein [Ktedonobacterales bacterium]
MTDVQASVQGDAELDRVRRILRGGVDLHVHTAPSPMPRIIDAVDAARQADELEMRAIVIKSHHHSTVVDVLALQKHGLQDAHAQVFGGIALNSTVGGLNPHAVDLALKQGGRIVWFPTIASPRHIEHHHAHPNLKFPKLDIVLEPEEPIDVFDEQGSLRPEVYHIIEQIRDADAILASGHMAPKSIIAVFKAAHDMGVRRLLVNHPNFVIQANYAEVHQLVDLGAVIEHSLCMYDDRSTFYEWDLDVLLEWLRELGPEHSSLGSDLGQARNPLPSESFVKIVRALLRAGMSEETLRQIVCDNPARLLGI